MTPRKQKLNLAKVLASLDTTCPACGYAIPPEEMRRLNFDTVQCPKCEEKFVPKKKP